MRMGQRCALWCALVGMVWFGGEATAASPARALGTEEWTSAEGVLAGWGLDRDQSFVLEFPPYVGDAMLIAANSGPGDSRPGVVLLRKGHAPRRFGIENEAAVVWGGWEGVAFYDLDEDGRRDVIALVDVCNGAACNENHYSAPIVLLNGREGLVAVDAWAHAIPYAVLKKGLGGIRTYAKANPPRLGN